MEESTHTQVMRGVIKSKLLLCNDTVIYMFGELCQKLMNFMEESVSGGKNTFEIVVSTSS